jgi:hypothetical protein
VLGGEQEGFLRAGFKARAEGVVEGMHVGAAALAHQGDGGHRRGPCPTQPPRDHCQHVHILAIRGVVHKHCHIGLQHHTPLIRLSTSLLHSFPFTQYIQQPGLEIQGSPIWSTLLSWALKLNPSEYPSEYPESHFNILAFHFVHLNDRELFIHSPSLRREIKRMTYFKYICIIFPSCPHHEQNVDGPHGRHNRYSYGVVKEAVE